VVLGAVILKLLLLGSSVQPQRPVLPFSESPSSPSPPVAPVEIPLVRNANHNATRTAPPRKSRPQNRSVNLSTAYNANAIYTERTPFDSHYSIDQVGSALAAELLGPTVAWGGVNFSLGPPNAPNAVADRTIHLPAGRFDGLKMLALGVNGNQEQQVFTMTYSDGTSSSFTQSVSDWYTPQKFAGESEAFRLPYRITGDGSRDERAFYIYGYSFALDNKKTVESFALPSNPEVLVLALTLVRGLAGNGSPTH